MFPNNAKCIGGSLNGKIKEFTGNPVLRNALRSKLEPLSISAASEEYTTPMEIEMYHIRKCINKEGYAEYFWIYEGSVIRNAEDL